jgi:hypothetical protein
MRPSAIVLVPLAVLAAGCGSGLAQDASSDDGPRIDVVAPTKPTTRIIGGTPKQRAVLRKILSGLGSNRIKSVELVTDDRNGVSFEAKVKQREDRYALWQAEVVGDVFARRSVALHLPWVAAVVDDEDGYATYQGQFSAPLSKQPLPLTAAKDDLRQVAEIAQEYGASVQVSLLQPDRPAFVVELRTSDPARFLRDGLDPTLAPFRAEDRQRHDGLYVKVTDGRGETVLESGAGLSVRADLSGCVHYMTGADGPGMLERPQCPAR